MTKHDKLSRIIQTTAQVDILTTGNGSKIVATGHISWAQTIKIVARALHQTSLEKLTALPQTH